MPLQLKLAPAIMFIILINLELKRRMASPNVHVVSHLGASSVSKELSVFCL